MVKLATRLLLIAGAAALIALLNVSEADADTCKSACSQIQRACGHVAKAARKAGLAQCDLDRDVCRDCGDDPNCPGWSPDCNDARGLCREAADTARQQARNVCRTARETCPEICVEPEHGCVKDCKSDQKDCARQKKKDSLVCKNGCKNDDNNRRCMRTCKRDLNLDLEICSDLEALCLGVCIGIVTP